MLGNGVSELGTFNPEPLYAIDKGFRVWRVRRNPVPFWDDLKGILIDEPRKGPMKWSL